MAQKWLSVLTSIRVAWHDAIHNLVCWHPQTLQSVQIQVKSVTLHQEYIQFDIKS